MEHIATHVFLDGKQSPFMAGHLIPKTESPVLLSEMPDSPDPGARPGRETVLEHIGSWI